MLCWSRVSLSLRVSTSLLVPVWNITSWSVWLSWLCLRISTTFCTTEVVSCWVGAGESTPTRPRPPRGQPGLESPAGYICGHEKTFKTKTLMLMSFLISPVSVELTDVAAQALILIRFEGVQFQVPGAHSAKFTIVNC